MLNMVQDREPSPVTQLLEGLATTGSCYEIVRFSSGRLERYTVWRSGRYGVLGRQCPDGSVSLEAIERTRLSAVVVHLVGLDDHPLRLASPADAEPIAIDLEVMIRFVETLAAGDASGAAAHLGDPTLDLPALRALHGLATGSRRTWWLRRTSCGPVTPEELAAVTVLDEGEAGLWAATYCPYRPEPAPLCPTTPEDLRTLLAQVLD